LPGWVGVVETVLAEPAATAEELERLSAGEPSPWLPCFAPFVRVARRRLGPSGLNDPGLFAPGAVAALERNLVRWLAFLFQQTLDLETRVLAVRRGLEPQTARDALARQLSTGGLRELLLEYAVLARLAATAVLRWTEVAGELAGRLAADREELAERFGAGIPPGPVTELETGLSDPHRGGRTVMALRFASGLRLVYKPRGVTMDLAWKGLLEWLAGRGMPVPLRTVAMLGREEHAWIEHLEYRPCADAGELRRYCRSAGALLFCAYLLDATDMHDGNLIGVGPEPVLIDLETLMEPVVRAMDRSQTTRASRLAEERLNRSVLRTAMLPTWREGPGGEVADIGGLGSILGSPSTAWYERTRESNPLTPELAAALARPGSGIAPGDLVEEVLGGFALTYRFAARHREALLAPDGPLGPLAGQPVRLLYRDTQIYMKLLHSSFAPEGLRDGVDRSLALEGVKRVLHWAPERPFFQPLLQAEAESMTRLDVPYFATRSDSDALFLEQPRREVPGFFTGPSHASVLRRTRELGETDLEAQLEDVRAAFELRLAAPPHTHPDAPDARDTRPAPLTDERAREAALELADAIAARALRGEDGSATWVAPVPFAKDSRFQIAPLPLDLASGAGGIAVFLAAAERARPGRGLGALALASLQPLQRALDSTVTDFQRSVAPSLGPGAASGWGGIVWALVRVAGLLGEDGALALARRAATALSPERIAETSEPGLNDGLAGALLGLLALAEADPAGDSLERAVACGRRLLEVRGASGALSLGATPSPGLGFGDAGVAWALARLHERTGDAALLQAARATARAVAATAPGPAEDGRATSTCHGSAGTALGLAVLAGAGAADPEDALRFARHAAEAPGTALQGLCCGSSGRADALAEIGARLGHPELVESARAAAAAGLARAEAAGGPRVVPGVERPLFAPGLLHGRAGIGYTLLRLSGAGILPAALLLE